MCTPQPTSQTPIKAVPSQPSIVTQKPLRMKGFSVILVLCYAAQNHSLFCWYGICPQQASPLPQDWQQTWEQVDNLVDVAPSQQVTVEWEHSGQIKTNATISSGVMTERPSLSWATEPGALYTVMIMDGGIKGILPKVYLHWMVTNIPATYKPHVDRGNEVMEYVTPFGFELNEDGSFIKDLQQSAHPMIMLVFKQAGRIEVEETQAGCTPDIFGARAYNYRMLVEKYKLEMVAGNFLQCPWSGYYTEQMICRFAKCTRKAFPFDIPSVTDRPECQPRKEIMDITVVGPQLSKQEEYAKYRSRYSLVSVISEIKNTYPSGSTGEITDFTAIRGSYNAPLRTNNQADTLEGIVDATFLFYPNQTASKFLFSNVAELFPSIGKTFPSLSGNRGFKVILSQPNDQDFHTEGLLNKRGMVFFLTIVEVKQGKEEEYQTMRDQLIGMYRSSKGSVASYKFDVDQEILEEQGSEDPLYYPSANNEVTIFVFDSQAARERVVAETGKKFDYNNFADTFTCIMCSLMTDQLRPEYYGPFNYGD